jgi:heme-degrading monooxygenase HmoA
MYIVVRRYTFKAGSTDEVARRAQEGFVPLIRQTPGFVSYYGVAEGNDRIFTVSIFQDQAGADESTKRAANWISQNLAEFVQGTPEIVAGEVKWQS